MHDAMSFCTHVRMECVSDSRTGRNVKSDVTCESVVVRTEAFLKEADEGNGRR